MSLCVPNINPSYHLFTSSNLSVMSYSSRAFLTSYSVNPNESSYISELVVTTLRLLRSENIDSLLTLVIPVITALSRYIFILKVELNRLLMNEANSCQ